MLTPSPGLFCSSPQPTCWWAGGTRSWEQAQLGQLAPAGQRDIPYHMVLCSVHNAGGKAGPGLLLRNWILRFLRILLSSLYLNLKNYFLPPVPSPILLRRSEQVAVWCSAACWVKQYHRAARIYLGSQQRSSWDSPSGSSGWEAAQQPPLWWSSHLVQYLHLAPLAPRVPWNPLGRTGGATVKLLLPLQGCACLQTC